MEQRQAQKTCYRRVKRWLREIVREDKRMSIAERSDCPCFDVACESAIISVSIWPYGGDDNAVINVQACVISHVDEITLELAKYLLRLNNELNFGAFSLDKNDSILFEHTIVGSTCDRDELRASVFAVLNTANNYDDKIISKYGGLSAAEKSIKFRNS
jgi:hypothetical protein